jgi:uncharacterized repeat protein (TIGR03843 family)
LDTNKQEQIKLLKQGALEVKGQFLFGSNYSFLVTLQYDGAQLEAIYKPGKGQMPLWDFPPESLADREVAAYIISDAMDWDLVPPTVIRRKAAFGKGSLQVFIQHDPDENYFTFGKKLNERLMPVALYDMVINNADRKASHILLDENGKIWLIDHGLSFHTDFKLRTVIWDFAGLNIPGELLGEIGRLNSELLGKKAVYNDLKKHLEESEIRAISRRIQSILRDPVFPQPDPERRSFPWPLV